jgi:hypothetical protein
MAQITSLLNGHTSPLASLAGVVVGSSKAILPSTPKQGELLLVFDDVFNSLEPEERIQPSDSPVESHPSESSSPDMADNIPVETASALSVGQAPRRSDVGGLIVTEPVFAEIETEDEGRQPAAQAPEEAWISRPTIAPDRLDHAAKTDAVLVAEVTAQTPQKSVKRANTVDFERIDVSDTAPLRGMEQPVPRPDSATPWRIRQPDSFAIPPVGASTLPATAGEHLGADSVDESLQAEPLESYSTLGTVDSRSIQHSVRVAEHGFPASNEVSPTNKTVPDRTEIESAKASSLEDGSMTRQLPLAERNLTPSKSASDGLVTAPKISSSPVEALEQVPQSRTGLPRAEDSTRPVAKPAVADSDETFLTDPIPSSDKGDEVKERSDKAAATALTDKTFKTGSDSHIPNLPAPRENLQRPRNTPLSGIEIESLVQPRPSDSQTLRAQPAGNTSPRVVRAWGQPESAPTLNGPAEAVSVKTGSSASPAANRANRTSIVPDSAIMSAPKAPLVAQTFHQFSELAVGAATERAVMESAPIQVATTATPLPPAETATTPPALPKAVAQQLAEASIRAVDRPVDLRLNPEELGNVRISMIMSDGSITLTVQAERNETLDLLRRHSDLLAQELRQLGYGSINFSFGQQGRPRDERSETPDKDAVLNTLSSTLAAQPRYATRNHDTGLDIRV